MFAFSGADYHTDERAHYVPFWDEPEELGRVSAALVWDGGTGRNSSLLVSFCPGHCVVSYGVKVGLSLRSDRTVLENTLLTLL